MLDGGENRSESAPSLEGFVTEGIVPKGGSEVPVEPL